MPNPTQAPNIVANSEPISKAGRLDLLAMDLLDYAARKYGNNPVVQSVYATYRPLAEAVTNEYLSPDVLGKKFSQQSAQPGRAKSGKSAAGRPKRQNRGR